MKRCLLAAAAVLSSVGVAEAQEVNGRNELTTARPLITLPQATRGVVFKTAAINPTGAVASCFRCVSALLLAPGQYQVVFDENVQAANGWSRWLQVDTLTTGAINNVSCTTADRAGVPNGVFVYCHTGTGVAVDTSFFLFVAR
jgi:hypothetical protein